MGNGFVGTIFQAYSQHRHLVLRPDDVWLAITTALSLYVNHHAEEMRHTFVEHEGKKELTVSTVANDIHSVNWNYLIDQFAEEIEKNTKNDIRSWLEPNFSTTTPTARTVGQVVLMAAMKKYFDFTAFITCGLRKVTLEGTLQDWQYLRTKASRLKDLGVDDLTHWAGLLDVVLAHFVKAFTGHPDKDFWGHICQKIRRGCGEAFLSGWVNVFIPFGRNDGEYRLTSADPTENRWGEIRFELVPPSTVEVPLLIDDQVNDIVYSTLFYGGHIVSVYNPSDDTIRPSLDWVVIDVTESLDRNGPCNSTDELCHLRERMVAMRDEHDQHKYWKAFTDPVKYKYRGLDQKEKPSGYNVDCMARFGTEKISIIIVAAVLVLLLSF